MTDISTDILSYISILSTIVSTDTKYYPPIYRPIPDTIDRYYIISTNVSAHTLVNTRAFFIDWLSVGRVSTSVSTDIYRLISTNTLSEGKVSVKHRCCIGEVSVNHQVYRPIGVSVQLV